MLASSTASHKQRSLVVGDVLLDRFVEGKVVARLAGGAGCRCSSYGAARPLLGGAGNVAANLLSYGATVTLVGVTGDDEAADGARGALRAASSASTAGSSATRRRPTTVKTRYLSGWHQLLRVDAEDTRADPGERRRRAARRRTRRRWPRRASLVLSDYAKGVLDATTIPAADRRARATAGAPVIVDPKKADAAIFAGATLLTPNVDEMAQLRRACAIDSDEARRPPAGACSSGSRSMRSW